MRHYFLSLCLYLLFLANPVSTYAITPSHTETATFAGGCFWTMQYHFDKVPGVVKTVVGYTGGKLDHPSYEQVSRGNTGHYEAIQVVYNPEKISYPQLLDIYWHTIDPTNANGQFCDTGSEYRTAIFYHDPSQQQLAKASLEKLNQAGQFSHIMTQITPASTFYPAEEYHQEFYQKNPVRFETYEYLCGRDQQLKQLWGK